MFPESFVEKHLAASRHDGVVFDPFCGRGTTVFQTLLNGREAIGCDVNPVAFVISKAKCDPPRRSSVLARIRELQTEFGKSDQTSQPSELEDFFKLCFHQETRAQVFFLRKSLDWKRRRTDRFIAAMALGALHGESHRSGNYFSNRMPRTISTKPGYSVRWWRERGYLPPQRDVFRILETMTAFRFASESPPMRGDIRLIDARRAGNSFSAYHGSVTDVITSPPYLDTTNYIEDQWLRLWFLGAPADSERARGDHRHTNEEMYWSFLEEVWSGINPLLAPVSRLIVRIGGRKVDLKTARDKLEQSVVRGTGRKVLLLDAGVTTDIRKTQANVFRGKSLPKAQEHDISMELTVANCLN
ncbi:MAG: hypothetical protein KDE22_10065, partial [Rhodobacterales bacterium]|nr:hypothetical protein [Rhodobacterales bacterium]